MTHYERSSPEVERAIWESEQERRRLRRERELSRYARQRELMEIPGDELPQAELRRRITAMLRRYTRISSLIPAPITLRLEDGEDRWKISGSLNRTGAGRILLIRDEHTENEQFELSSKGRGKETEVTHRERGMYDISWHSKNSEREIRPAEELFDRLIAPLEIKMGLAPAAQVVVFPS